MMDDESVSIEQGGFNQPLLVLDISKADTGRLPNDRSRSAERDAFRLHVVFGKDHGVVDFHRKKNWVFDSELQVTKSRYLDLLRMFKDSLEDIENRPKFVTFASNYFIFANIKF